MSLAFYASIRAGCCADDLRRWPGYRDENARAQWREDLMRPAAGHVANIDRPEAFNAAILAFLARLARPNLLREK
jgi:pimeloyl-ACP methyl ester carboxylesterase